eukprot:TRINITY_DN12312_c0_g1_i11.p5 TRINITY_DN12312_c0_g1~~TRINITY_DN12312_c0_g1_i11.p5  ORF type:complete len:135 (-),score=4.30 TRINITY_DN12312_c0_g1_i11:2862-3266(-)
MVEHILATLHTNPTSTLWSLLEVMIQVVCRIRSTNVVARALYRQDGTVRRGSDEWCALLSHDAGTQPALAMKNPEYWGSSSFSRTCVNQGNASTLLQYTQVTPLGFALLMFSAFAIIVSSQSIGCAFDQISSGR